MSAPIPDYKIDWHLWLNVAQLVVLPVLLWLGRRIGKSFLADLDARIANAADIRIGNSRKLILEHIDNKFTEHEACDNRILERLGNIERGMERGSERFGRIESVLYQQSRK